MHYYFIFFGLFMCISTSFININEVAEAVKEMTGMILVCFGYLIKEIRNKK